MPKLSAKSIDWDRPLPMDANPASFAGAAKIRDIYRWARENHPMVPPSDVIHELVAELGFALEGYESSVELGMRIARYADLFENEEDAWDICQSNYEDAIDSCAAGEVSLVSADDYKQRFVSSAALAERFQSSEGRKRTRAHAAFDAGFRDRVPDLRQILADCLDEDLDRVMAEPFIIAIEDSLQENVPALLGFFVVVATVNPAPDETARGDFEF